MALPVLKENSVLTLTGTEISTHDIALTVDMLKKFGIETESHGTTFYIRGSQKYISPGVFSISGDWSAAAVWLCAGALSQNDFTVRGLDIASLQDDKKILDYLEQFGANIKIGEQSISVCGRERRAFNVDVFDTQNLFPLLAVLASVAKGTSVFYNIKNLYTSDRLRFTMEMLIRLSAIVKKTEDSFEITGKPVLLGNAVSSYNDPCIAMAAALATQICIKKTLLNGAEAVNKSYPGFYRDYRRLGGEVIAHI